MDTEAYPGKGLSLSQLVFALNEELKRKECFSSRVRSQWPVCEYTDVSYRLTLDNFSQLERDTSAALATIRDWINSFAPINRLPTDVLFLISTHLPHQGDHFRVTFVCRHWRRTFLQHAGLWSHLDLSKGEVYLKTLLERARDSPLSILANDTEPVGDVNLLPLHAKRITDIKFTDRNGAVIQRFLEISGAVGLRELRLHSRGTALLSTLVFPNLTFFKLTAARMDWFCGPELLDFLEASTMLRTVRMKIYTDTMLEDIPQERVAVLHNVENFCLVTSEGALGYKISTHISCPSAKHTSLTHARSGGEYPTNPQEIFPASAFWKAIIRQYTRSPIEEVTFETTTNSDSWIACSLSFRSADAATIELRFEVANNLGLPERSFAEMYSEVFLEASRAIRDLPLLANVKRIHMCGPRDLVQEGIESTVTEIGELLKSLGPLDELTISRCDIQPYIYPFLHQTTYGPKESVTYPPIRVLTISNPSDMVGEDAVAGLVKLARVQHELGVPFERMVIRTHDPPADIEERLRPWVGLVDCCGMPYEGD